MKVYLAVTWLSHNPDRDSAQPAGLRAASEMGAAQGRRLRLLLSYYYYKSADLGQLLTRRFEQPYPELFGDSGAFSAWAQGTSVDVSAYGDWLQRNERHLAAYANLDVKGDVDAGLRNQAYLESRGLHPLPVFHAGEPWSVLEDMLASHRYIALGGVAGEKVVDVRLLRWLIKCFKLAEGRAVFHGFGMTRIELTARLPWYSIDSTSWAQAFRFGRVSVFDPQQVCFHNLRLGDYGAWLKRSELIRAYGFNPLDFADRARNDLKKQTTLGAVCFLELEQWLVRRWGDIAIPGEPEAGTGPRIYLASSRSLVQESRAAAGIRALDAPGGN